MREWLRQNGGPPALVIVGIGLVFAFWPLGAAFILVGCVLWLYSWTHFPLMVVRKSDARAVAQSDAAIIAATRAQVEQLGLLLAQHVRHAPPPQVADPDLDADPPKAWARGVERDSRHAQSIVAKFFEDNYAGLMSAISQLHARGALSDEEVRHINWEIGGLTMGSPRVHGLSGVTPTLMTAIERLESGRLMTRTAQESDEVSAGSVRGSS